MKYRGSIYSILFIPHVIKYVYGDYDIYKIDHLTFDRYASTKNSR